MEPKVDTRLAINELVIMKKGASWLLYKVISIDIPEQSSYYWDYIAKKSVPCIQNKVTMEQILTGAKKVVKEKRGSKPTTEVYSNFTRGPLNKSWILRLEDFIEEHQKEVDFYTPVFLSHYSNVNQGKDNSTQQFVA
jgi:hypothetical protein